MDRTDRLFLQTQLRGLDQMIRDASDMRSVLLRRIRRMEAAPPVQRRRPVARPLPVENPVNLIPEMNLEQVPPPLHRVVQLNRELNPVVTCYGIPIVKTRNFAIKKTEWESVMTDACGICLETHKTAESCVCNCKHRFGQECFDGWNRICSENRRATTCPTCREPVTVITNFRQRQSTKRKASTVPVETQVQTIVQPIIVLE